MAAQVDVLFAGYVGERVAGTVTLVRENDTVIVIDPGMVPSRQSILDPLRALGVQEDHVTDVIFSHHHPDHTLNAALFLNANVHDVWAVYRDDVWGDRVDVIRGAPSVSLLDTPGHTPQDLSTLIRTNEGLVVCTHLWWSQAGPIEDPLADSQSALEESRRQVLALEPTMIIPGHGPAFTPDALNG
ncbi:MAG: MBL fold metallo-hydrolase [Acidobacteriota bacterium]|nr:MBL fold metallo-hydrolase [Acidobacteriota bacterium]